MEVGDAEFVEVVEVLDHTGEGSGEPIGVRDVADHVRLLEPVGLCFALQITQEEFVGASSDVPNDTFVEALRELFAVVGIQLRQPGDDRRPVPPQACVQHRVTNRQRGFPLSIHGGECILLDMQAFTCWSR